MCTQNPFFVPQEDHSTHCFFSLVKAGLSAGFLYKYFLTHEIEDLLRLRAPFTQDYLGNITYLCDTVDKG